MTDTNKENNASSNTPNDSYIRLISNDKFWFILLAFAIFLIAINATRLTANNFWGDEVYSIGVAKMTSYIDIIDYAIHIDSHPPLYNMMLHTMCVIFGYNPITYHLTPMIAYIGIVILSITTCYRYFGKTTSFILLILSSSLIWSFYYIPETRMYELGAFLMLASFICLYKILKFGSKIDYILFIICTVAAAYTHYYCALADIFLYLILIIDPIVKKNRNLKINIWSCIIALLAYSPWIYAFIYAFMRDSKDFWIQEIMTPVECFEYLFYSDNSIFLFSLFWILALILCSTGVIHAYEKSNNIKKILHDLDPETTWIIAGLVCIFGTIAVGIIVSNLYRPLIYDRYLYPLAAIAWIIFSVGISKVNWGKAKKIIPTLFVVTLLLVGIPNIFSSIDVEKQQNTSTSNIVEQTDNLLVGDDVLYTNIWHLANNVLDYYFPDTKSSMMDDETISKLDPTKHNMLFLNYWANDDMIKQFKDHGYNLQYVIDGSFAKQYYTVVYDVCPI